MRTKILFSVILIALMSTAVLGQSVMIVNKDNPVNGITRAEAANYFMGKATMWSAGVKVVIVDQKKASPAGAAFLQKIVKMDESTYKNLWVEKMLSGEAVPPVNKASDAEVVEFVKANPGAIGYISAAAAHEGVKVLSVDNAKEW